MEKSSTVGELADTMQLSPKEIEELHQQAMLAYEAKQKTGKLWGVRQSPLTAKEAAQAFIEAQRKKRTGITTTPKAKRTARSRKREQAAAASRRRNR